MRTTLQELAWFVARYAVYTVLPGFWFAYIAGISIWIGGMAGLIVALLLAIPILISSRRKPARGREHPGDILEGKP